MPDSKKPNFVLSIVGIIILMALVYHYTAVYFETQEAQATSQESPAVSNPSSPTPR